MTPRHVMIVDDEYDIARAIEAVLSDEGYATQICTDCREALRRLRGGGSAPALILVDGMMPFMSGLELIAALRTERELQRVPVILMNGIEPRVSAGERHWRSFLRKPFDLATLLGAVESAIGRSSEAHA